MLLYKQLLLHFLIFIPGIAGVQSESSEIGKVSTVAN